MSKTEIKENFSVKKFIDCKINLKICYSSYNYQNNQQVLFILKKSLRECFKNKYSIMFSLQKNMLILLVLKSILILT